MQHALPPPAGYVHAKAGLSAATSPAVDTQAIEAAADELSAWDANTRRHAVQTLGLQGLAASDHVEQMAKLLKDEEPEVRKATALAIGRIATGAANVAGELSEALGDNDAEVRAAAVTALSHLGQEVAIRFAQKVACLVQDRDENVALAAVSCLAALGEAKMLGPFLSSEMPAVAKAALVEVGRCPEARQRHALLVSKSLMHQDAAVRLAAVQASGDIGAQCSKDHFSCLASLHASEKHVKVRRAAVQALGRAGSSGAPYLLSFLGDGDEGIRHFAAETLAATGGEVGASCASDLLGDRNAALRQAALQALGKNKLAGGAFASEIAGCLHDTDFAVRLAAIQALNDLEAAEVAPELGALVKDEHRAVRQAAVVALSKMGAEGAAYALRFLEDTDPGVRQSAVKVYSPLHSKLKAELAKPYADTVVLRLLDEDWRVRLAAAVALGDLHATGFAEHVAALSRDPDNQVRRSAVTALAKMGAPLALVAVFLGDSDPGVCQDAGRAFAELGGDDNDGELSEPD